MPDNSDQRISFTCPECEAHLKVPAKLAGVTGPCPKCHGTITAPSKSIEKDVAVATETPVDTPPLEPDEAQPKPLLHLDDIVDDQNHEQGEEASTMSETETESSIPVVNDPVLDDQPTLDTAPDKEDQEPDTNPPGIPIDDLPVLENESEDEEKKTSYQILPSAVPDAKATPSFPPFPSDSSSQDKTGDSIPDIGSTMPVTPVPSADNNIPDIGSTMPVTPVPSPDNSIPDFGSTMPVTPVPSTDNSIPDFGSTMPVTPVPGTDDPVIQEGSTIDEQSEALSIDETPQSEKDGLPVSELEIESDSKTDPAPLPTLESKPKSTPKLLPIPGIDTEEVIDDEPETISQLLPIPGLNLETDDELTPEESPELNPIQELEQENSVEPEPEPEPEIAVLDSNSAIPFQPFFLPGQTPPALDLSIHFAPIYPGSSPVQPGPKIFQGNARAIVATKTEPSSATESSVDTKSSSPAFVFPTADDKSSKSSKPVLPTPSISESAFEDDLPSSVESDRSSFAGLIKGLIIFALFLFVSIGLLVTDYYAGGVSILHKLPGFASASSFVSAVLTPPDVSSSLSDPDVNPDPQVRIDPKSDTIAKADLTSSIENENTIEDSLNSASLTTPPKTSPKLTDASTKPDLDNKQEPITNNSKALEKVAMTADLKNSTEINTEKPTKQTVKEDTPPTTNPLPAASTDTFKFQRTPINPENSSFFSSEKMTVSPSAQLASSDDIFNPANFASYPSEPAPSKSDTPPEASSIAKQKNATPPIKAEMIRNIPVELPNASDKAKSKTNKPKLTATVISTPHSGPAKTASNAKTNPNRLLADPRKVLEAFLHAKSWKERLPYIYNNKTLARSVEEYYKNDPLGPISDYTLEFINMERSRSDNTLFYVFFFITNQMPDGYPLILRTEDGKLKVDWEIFAEFNDQHFKYFVEGESSDPHPLRIMIKRASYWGPDKDKFTELNDYLCFGISAPPFPEEGKFAFVKKGSPLADKLEQSLPWGKPPVSGIVEFEKVKLAHGNEHLMIKSIVTDGWFSPTAP